jgi:hypothetical protein
MLERRSILLLAAIVVVTLVLAISCTSNSVSGKTIDINDLLTSPGKYNGRDITVEGYYFSGFEIVVISDTLQPSTFAQGNVIPGTPMVWLTGNFPDNFKDGLLQ